MAPLKLVYYEQISKREGIPPRDYYNPSVFLADKPFRLYPGEEILVIINGCGYRYNDDSIFKLSFKSFMEEDMEVTAAAAAAAAPTHYSDIEYVVVPASDQQLCLLVKNFSTENTISVGYKTPLTWLLDMPRIDSKLCFCSMTELTSVKLHVNRQGHNRNAAKSPHSIADVQPVAEDKTIFVY